MKKILIATVATAALAIAAPAFAQVAGDVTGTVQGQTQVTPPNSPVPQTTQDTQDAVDATTDEAQEAAEAPPQVPTVATAEAVPPATEADMSAEAEVTPGQSAEATASADAALAAPAAEVQTAATAETAVEAAEDMPMSVQEAVNDGSYTTDDLNRAQLAALQSPTQGSR